MNKELSKDTKIKISIQTLIAIGATMATIISMWFVLKSDIDEAKKLPKVEPEITRIEYDMKDQLIRQTIETTGEDVKEIKDDMKRLEEKIDRLYEN